MEKSFMAEVKGVSDGLMGFFKKHKKVIFFGAVLYVVYRWMFDEDE
jgi:hypothetical protein